MSEREQPHVLRIVRKVTRTPEPEAPTQQVEAPTLQLDERERIQTLVYSVLDEVDFQAGGNYVGLVPTQWKPDVVRLSTVHYPHYQGEFSSQEEFTNAFARNWVAKHRSFDRIAQARGFETPTKDTSLETYNKAVIAGLTRSSSYIFLGPGSLDPTGEGSMLSYARIPLRYDPEMSDVFVSKGAHIVAPPVLGKGLPITYTRDGTPDGFTTAPILSSFITLNSDNPVGAIQGFVDTVRFGSSAIDATFLRRATGSGSTARSIPPTKQN